jgi:SAM-dependent methyltransferase
MINTRYFNISYLAIILIILIICYSSYNKFNKETFTDINIDELYEDITGHIPINILKWNVHHTYGEVTNEGMKILNEAFNNHGPLDKFNIPKKTFYDLGCGVGKLIITIANNNSKINSVGYEIVTDRINNGKTVLSKIKDKKLLDRITLKEQDIFDKNLDFTDACWIFFSNLCLKLDDFKILNDKLEKEAPVGCVIICSKEMNFEKTSRFKKITDTLMVPMSWGKDSKCLMYKKI